MDVVHDWMLKKKSKGYPGNKNQTDKTGCSLRLLQENLDFVHLAQEPGRARQLMPARGHPRAYPPPPACDVLDWREAASVGGVYGVGLQLGAQPPPVVQRVSQLLDPDGEGEGVGRE
jgi:hypothetical protein